MKNNPLIIYQTEDGQIKIETHLENETIWLSQAQIGELFQKSKATISEHIKHIFNEGELEQAVVVRDFRTTTKHGAIEGKTQNKTVKHYNLDVIISVGYRVCLVPTLCMGMHTDGGSNITLKQGTISKHDILRGLLVMVSKVCIPTQERGNERVHQRMVARQDCLPRSHAPRGNAYGWWLEHNTKTRHYFQT